MKPGGYISQADLLEERKKMIAKLDGLDLRPSSKEIDELKAEITKAYSAPSQPMPMILPSYSVAEATRPPLRVWVGDGAADYTGARRKLFLQSDPSVTGGRTIMTAATIEHSPVMAEANVKYAVDNFVRETGLDRLLVEQIVDAALQPSFPTLVDHRHAEKTRSREAQEVAAAHGRQVRASEEKRRARAAARQAEWDAIHEAFNDQDGSRVIDYDTAAPLRQFYMDKYGVDPLDDPRPGIPSQVPMRPKPDPMVTVTTRTYSPGAAVIRDSLMFAGGLGLIAYEAGFGSGRPTLMAVGAAMMGLPAFTRPR